MKLTVVGCSGSFPGPASPSSCYLVEAEGFRLLLDLGSGALGPLQRHTDVADLDAVLISHLHPDHCLDLAPLYVVRRYDPRGTCPVPLPVYGPAGTGERTRRGHAVRADEGMDPVFDFHTLVPGALEIGPFRVTVDRVNHPVETFGSRIEHAGRVLAFSADTGSSPELVGLARDADLMLCEAAFHDGRDTVPDLHLNGREAGEHAVAAGAASLVLTHIPPWNDPQATLAEAAAVWDGPLSLAVPDAVTEV